MKKVTEESKTVEKKTDPNSPTEMIMSLELAQSLMNYLGSKPYGEVAELIKGIQSSKLQ